MSRQSKFQTVLLVALILALAGMVAQHVYKSRSAPKTPQSITVMTPRECLARNLAFETAGNSHLQTGAKAKRAHDEMEAISRVVFQRAALGRRHGYRNTICEVVYQHGQFSWTLKLPRDAKPQAPGRWQFMLSVADDMLAGHFTTPWPAKNECITHYKRADNKYVGKKPAIFFRTKLRQVTVYGDHAFFCPKKPQHLQRTAQHPASQR